MLTNMSLYRRDRLLRFGEASELDSDSDAPVEHSCRTFGLAFESSAIELASPGRFTEMRRTQQLIGLREIEGNPDTEHRNIDDQAVAPFPNRFACESAGSSPAGRKAINSDGDSPRWHSPCQRLQAPLWGPRWQYGPLS